MNYLEILSGREEPLPIYIDISECVEDLERFPFRIEAIYRQALELTADEPDRLRFALVRMQVYADIHRYEDMEKTQKLKYVAQVLEKVIFGNLMLEQEESTNE